MSGGRTRARRAAVQALYQWELTGTDAPEISEQFVKEHDMSEVDVSYFTELVREVPLHVHELEDHFSSLLDRSPEEVDPVERAILWIGTYELEFRPDVPYRAAINEAVELAKVFGAEDGYKYVNGVLDKVARKLRSVEIESGRRRGPRAGGGKK